MKTIVKDCNYIAGLIKELRSPVNISIIGSCLIDQVRKIDISNPSKILNCLPALPGLYYLEADFSKSDYLSLDHFGDLWGKPKGEPKGPKDCPRYSKKRAEHHTVNIGNHERIPFYLGKSENIKKRVTEHINLPISSQTYSLKLFARKELLENIEFHLGYIDLQFHNESFLLLNVFESYIREDINPIIGKQ